MNNQKELPVVTWSASLIENGESGSGNESKISSVTDEHARSMATTSFYAFCTHHIRSLAIVHARAHHP